MLVQALSSLLSLQRSRIPLTLAALWKQCLPVIVGCSERMPGYSSGVLASGEFLFLNVSGPSAFANPKNLSWLVKLVGLLRS